MDSAAMAAKSMRETFYHLFLSDQRVSGDAAAPLGIAALPPSTASVIERGSFLGVSIRPTIGMTTRKNRK